MAKRSASRLLDTDDGSSAALCIAGCREGPCTTFVKGSMFSRKTCHSATIWSLEGCERVILRGIGVRPSTKSMLSGAASSSSPSSSDECSRTSAGSPSYDCNQLPSQRPRTRHKEALDHRLASSITLAHKALKDSQLRHKQT